MPRFLELTASDPAVVEATLTAAWDGDRLETLLRHASVQEAWEYLSDAAEYALGAVCSPDRVRRSTLWDPIQCRPPQHRCGPEGHQSETLRALGSLKSKLRHLRDQPSHELRAKIGRVLGHLRGKLPGFPFLDLSDALHAIDLVDCWYDHLAAQEKEARIQTWKEEHFKSSRACVAWIKRRSRVANQLEQTPCDPEAPPRAIHPAEVVRDQSELWTSKWNPEDPIDQERVESLLRNFRPLPQCEDQIQITGPQLIRANNKMKGKAPGPDGWTPEQLALLPAQWWEAVARCWNCCIASGQFPRQWRRATIALLHKRKDETRPIALCSVIWRAGARSIAASLRKWCETWCHHGALGAAPGRSTSCAHARLLLARAQGASAFVQQDLSSFFDSIDVNATCLLLKRFGAPTSLCTVLQAFYSEPGRIFRVGLWHSSRWTSCTRGFLQGCPLSPLISLVIGTAWSLYANGTRDAQGFLSIAPATTDNLIYVDDRIVWPTQCSDNPVKAVREALARSDEFDAAFHFQCKPSKCAIAACPGVHTLAILARQRGYKQVQCLDVLGVSFDLSCGSTSPLKFCLRHLIRQLRMLRTLNPCLEVKRLVLQTLVHSAMFWASGVTSPSEADMSDLRTEIRALLSLHVTDEAPWVLLAAVHGWQWDPYWIRDWRALIAAWRFVAKPPCWLDTVPLPDTVTPWTTLVPEALSVVTRLGWSVSPDGCSIIRTDDAGQTRRVNIGWDSPAVLRQWLVDAHQLTGVHRCGRVKTSLHRDDPTCARGLCLPAPAVTTRFALGGHQQLGRTGPLAIRRAALATAGSGWYWRASLRLPKGTVVNCMCNGKFPSRPHVTWSCPFTASCRAGLALPCDRAAERLFAASVPERPAAPPSLAYEELISDITEHLRRLLSDQNRVQIATDGSALEDVGAYAVVSSRPEGVFATGDSSEDQSAYRQEALAMLALFRGLVGLTGHSQGCVQVLYDCEAVVAGIRHPEGAALPGLFAELRAAQATLHQRNLLTELIWVPSHGKNPMWRAPAGLSVSYCRELNAKADAAANAARDNRWRHSARRRWHQAHREAVAWERAAILASAGASGILQTHLERPVPLP